MEVLLVDLDSALCEAWRETFAGLSGVEVVCDDFRSQLGRFDCFVSPANSFGLMDGGIDAVIRLEFGVALEHRVQQAVWEQYRGEQPVGTSLLVPTGDRRCPWLAHCPTMRVPMVVADTHHAYAAFLAALTTAGNAGIKKLACPGLGTFTGRMPPAIAARQMRYAFDLWRDPRAYPTWSYADRRVERSFGRAPSSSQKTRGDVS